MTASVVSKYLEWQTALRDYGVTSLAEGLFWQLANEIESDPFLDSQAFQPALMLLHDRAYPIAATRPPRLTAGALEDIRE